MSHAKSLIGALFAFTMATGCSHELAVRNLDVYSAPVRLQGVEHPFRVAVLPFSGRPDETFYFNALVERIHQSPSVSEARTDYIAGKAGSFEPDVILSIRPAIEYRSSGWNFLINWPGFLIFTPAWNGYVYHADIVTHVGIHDGDGNLVSQEDIPISYDIRQAEMDRTIWTGLTWLEVSVLALVGGIYNAFVFDDDILDQLQVQVKDNYTTYVANQVAPKIIAAFERSRPAPPVAPAPVGEPLEAPGAVEAPAAP